MFSKNYFFVFFASLFVAGFIFLSLPDKGFTQGCCRNAGSSTSCIPGNSFPNGDMDTCLQAPGPTKEWLEFDLCEKPPEGGSKQCIAAVGCCIEVQGMCAETTKDDCDFDWNFNGGNLCEGTDECMPVMGCCVTTGPDACNITTSGDCTGRFTPNQMCNTDRVTCAGTDPLGCCPEGGGQDCMSPTTGTDGVGVCLSGGTFSPGLDCNNEGTCGQLGCCQDAGPSCSLTNFNDCDGTDWIPGGACNDDTQAPFEGFCRSLTPGCCDLEQDGCSDSTAGECQDMGLFNPGDSCLDDGSCGTPPDGCCQDSIDPNECSIVSQIDCAEQNFFGDVGCVGGDEFCNAEGCCFLDVNGVAAASNRAIDPEKCIDTIPDNCPGVFQGPGTNCALDFPVQCASPGPPVIVSPIPTIGQWGLIAMAGLLGLFSLFIMVRRHRYNVG